MEYCGPPNGPLYKSGCYWRYKKESTKKTTKDEDTDKMLHTARIIVSLEIVAIVVLWLILMTSFV